MKSHVVAKIILTLMFTLVFTFLFILTKEIYLKEDVNKRIELINKIDHSTFNGNFSQFSYDWSEYLSTKSNTVICIGSLLFCSLLVFVTDMIAGVGRRSPIFHIEENT